MFQCQYPRKIWLEFEKDLDLKIELHHIILGIQSNKDLSCIIPLIAYFIYKDWLVKSMAYEERADVPNLHVFRANLKYRCDICKYLGWKDKCTI